MREDTPTLVLGMALGFMLSTLIFVSLTRPAPAAPNTQTIVVRHEGLPQK